MQLSTRPMPRVSSCHTPDSWQVLHLSFNSGIEIQAIGELALREMPSEIGALTEGR
jgi:hypothetical protein